MRKRDFRIILDFRFRFCYCNLLCECFSESFCSAREICSFARSTL